MLRSYINFNGKKKVQGAIKSVSHIVAELIFKLSEYILTLYSSTMKYGMKVEG